MDVSPFEQNSIVAENSSNALDPFDIDYSLLEDGRVRVLGQTGLQYLSDYVYCDVPDQIYVELWDQALARWEEVFSEGLADEIYPYDIDGFSELEIDDIYVYFGFSDSYASSSSLGSSLNAGYYRDNGLGQAATGSLVFNAKYFVANPSEKVQTVFYNTALHELAHSFGYNVNHMNATGLIERTSSAPFDLDDVFSSTSGFWNYIGDKGVERYQETFPEDFRSLSSTNGFLMETYTASGSFGAHLSSVLGTYYLFLNQRDGMNYSISPSFKATITSMTLGVLEDMGYKVDYDFADAHGSPSPVDPVVETSESGVEIVWTKSPGTYSSSASNPEFYTVQRKERGTELWIDLATDLLETNFFDETVEPGKEYKYRIIANNVRTNEEIGAFKAKAGDVLSWNSSGAKYRVYALVNNGSDALVWTKVLDSTTETSWVVETLEKSPGNGETLFRVIALGNTLERSEPSKAVSATIPEAPEVELRIVSPGTLSATSIVVGEILSVRDIEIVNKGRSFSNAFSVSLFASLDGELDAEDVLLGSRRSLGIDPRCSETIGSVQIATNLLTQGETYKIVCLVSSESDGDSSNNTAIASTELRVFIENADLPNISLDRDSYEVEIGNDFLFSASSSNFVPPSNVAYYVDFGNGVFVKTNETAWTSFESYGAEQGEKTVTLKIVDLDAGEAVARGIASLSLKKSAPTLRIETTPLLDGRVLNLNLSVYSAMRTQPIQKWEIEWSDGTRDERFAFGHDIAFSHFFDDEANSSTRFATISIYDSDLDKYEFLVQFNENSSTETLLRETKTETSSSGSEKALKNEPLKTQTVEKSISLSFVLAPNSRGRREQVVGRVSRCFSIARGSREEV
ncbi:MAG: hypothetical protein IJM30_06200 [Thermoguttaceae bacterium]|nr:hypothetical protein [Thermoguttaceae bacterium]